MEYRVETTGYASDEAIVQAVKAFLNPSSGPSPSFRYGYDVPTTQSSFNRGFPFRDDKSVSRPGSSFGLSGQQNGSSRPIDPRVRFVAISNWGGAQNHYFIVGNRRMLRVGRWAMHPQWSYLTGSWTKSISLQPVASITVHPTAGKSVAQMTDTEKLTEAMSRALPRIPDHLKKAVEDLLTPVNIALFVGITVVLMSSGVGEVLGIGLLAFGFVAGGLDLCINVLKMVFDFYRKATRATTEHELDQAAELFVQIVLRGGMDILDILDILVGRRAAAKLAGGPAVRQGLRSVGMYLGHLEREMPIW